MILSDVSIQSSVENGDITIDPFNEGNLNPASYTFTLADTIYRPVHSRVMDARHPDTEYRPTHNRAIDARHPEIQYEEVEVCEDGYLLRTANSVVGRLNERITLPSSVCCRLDALTSLARIGLSVLQGSTLIEPGQQDGQEETLEIVIVNVGGESVRIFSGQNIVKGVFEQLSVPSQGTSPDRYLAQAGPVPL